MLNEHEREDGPEEGEYHFSDEGGYETNMEEETKAPVVTEGGGLAAKFASYRRFVIIGAVFAGLLLVVYLIIPPLTTSAPPTDIAAVSPPTSAEGPVESSAPQATTPSAPPPAVAAAAAPSAEPVESHPAGKSFANLISAEKEKLAAEKNKVMAHMTSQPPASSLTLPSEQLTIPGSTPGQPSGGEPASTTAEAASPPSMVAATIPQELVSSPVGSMMMPGQQTTPQVAAENKALLERLTAIGETNTKLIGQLHAEYVQKLTAYETQDKVLQEQVRTLNARLVSMEVEMNKLVQALNKQQASVPNDNTSNMSENNNNNNNNLNLQGSSSATVVPVAPLPIQVNSKASYTVQAIIPGRAWLRTDSGETITVAEGDLLKNLGRVTKIDPYDGTIQVDTGTKVVTLTYGNGDYA